MTQERETKLYVSNNVAKQVPWAKISIKILQVLLSF